MSAASFGDLDRLALLSLRLQDDAPDMAAQFSGPSAGEQAVQHLRSAVAMKWFEPARVLGVLDSWHTDLVQAFDAVLEGDSDRIMEQQNSPTAQEFLSMFNGWLGRDIIWSIVEFMTAEDEYYAEEYGL